MIIPLNWLSKYIKIEHTPEELASILTNLEFMLDKPIFTINNHPILDLEVRQNRSDCFSILGIAREYAAFLGKKVSYPLEQTEINTKWNEPKKILSVTAKDVVKRFCAVEITNIKVKQSPDWLREDLEEYGIPAINNIVDITNYVMLEYGIPLHAFDIAKLSPNTDGTLIQVRKAQNGEEFLTWQGTKIEFSSKDLIISSGNKPVGIAGVIGGQNSGIDSETNAIILEAACYDHATIRRMASAYNLRTDAASRHSKILNPNMVEKAIKRALKLILELTEGEITSIEDFYEEKLKPVTIEFNLVEISRLGGVDIEKHEVISILETLQFEVIEQKEAIGLDQNIIIVRVPEWRTDINIQADLVEEVLRLWGYSKIPVLPIREAPEDFSTTKSILLEDKIRDILTSFGLDEHYTNPLVQKDENKKFQVKLENPLNQDKNALRTSITETLIAAFNQNIKSNPKLIGVFEIGKIYAEVKQGQYTEQKIISTIYNSAEFGLKVKSDLLALLFKLGIINSPKELNYKSIDKNWLSLIKGKIEVATLSSTGFNLKTEELLELVDLNKIPKLQIKTKLTQNIIEEISIITNKELDLFDLENMIYDADPSIIRVYESDNFSDISIGENKISHTISIEFENSQNELTREKIEAIRSLIIKKLTTEISATIRGE